MNLSFVQTTVGGFFQLATTVFVTVSSGIYELFKTLWQGILNNVFALTATLVTVVGGPLMIAHTQHDLGKTERVAARVKMLVDEISKLNDLSDNELSKLRLLRALLADNETALELQSTGLKSEIDALIQTQQGDVDEEKKAQELSQALVAKEKESQEALANLERERAGLSDEKSKAEKEIQELKEKLVGIQGQAAASEQDKARLSELEKKNQELESRIGALVQPPPEPEPEEIIDVTKEARTISKQSRLLTQTLVKKAELESKVKELHEYIISLDAASWVYLGWLDEQNKFQDSRLEDTGNQEPKLNKTLAASDQLSVRVLPTAVKVPNIVATTLSKGTRIRLGELVRLPKLTLRNATQIPVWGRITKITPPNGGWIARVFSK